MNLLVNNEANECVELLINTVTLKSLLNVLIRKKTGQPSFVGVFLKNQMIIKSIINLKLLRVILIECLIMIFWIL